MRKVRPVVVKWIAIATAALLALAGTAVVFAENVVYPQ